MQLHAGTSGFSYKEWRGKFYPDKLAAARMLAYYAERLPAVEINNTFYRMPKRELLENWASQVSPEFRFAIKASQRITHKKRLKDCGEELQYLLSQLQVMQQHLGVVLFQLPPYLRKDATRLREFLALLPREIRAAFEFRHGSWFDEEIFDSLRQVGAALCTTDSDDQEQPSLIPTASHGYLRLRRSRYSREDMLHWVDRLAKTSWQRVFVFFKHEDDCGGPVLAQQLLALHADRQLQPHPNGR